VRDILETSRVDKPESIEVLSRLEKNAEKKHSIPTYESGQEKVLHHTVRFDEETLNYSLGQVQVEFYGNNSIEAVGDRFIIEEYFPESSYE
jgi:hypothetical protein